MEPLGLLINDLEFVNAMFKCLNPWKIKHLGLSVSSYPFVKINILRKGKFTEKNQKLHHFIILWQTKYWRYQRWWILNASVRGRVSSSRTRFWTLPNLNSEVSKPKILLFSYWFFMQIRHRTLPNLYLEVSNSTIFSNISFIPNIWKLN